jgi:hypothetical protein
MRLHLGNIQAVGELACAIGDITAFPWHCWHSRSQSPPPRLLRGSIPSIPSKVAVLILSLGRRVPPKSITNVRGGRQLYGALHDRRIRGSTKHSLRSSLYSTSYLFHHPACSGGLGSSRPHWTDCLVSRDLTRRNEGASKRGDRSLVGIRATMTGGMNRSARSRPIRTARGFGGSVQRKGQSSPASRSWTPTIGAVASGQTTPSRPRMNCCPSAHEPGHTGGQSPRRPLTAAG